MGTASDIPDFTVHRSELPDRGLSLGYWREGVGGLPLLLVHGYPETKRIWARNVEPLVAAGFEVIVPDLRGYGDSDLAPDGHYDPACYGRDLQTLCQDVLGHEWIVAAGGDVGGAVLSDLSARFPGYVRRQAIFNTIAPMLAGDAYDGIPSEQAPFPMRDYFEEQGADADALMAELATPDLRRRYVFGMYAHRLWGAPGGFTRDEIHWHTEPFADADKLRAAMGVYELSTGKRPISELPAGFDPNPTDTLILYGPEDHVVGPSFVDRMQVAFPNHRGPFHVP
ncbi:MAG: alpha/beta hydrolase, partial [Acidimicrobiales bacterium]|nr:alpha/beta hydrolase [Acidimicrobiales bacterium]